MGFLDELNSNAKTRTEFEKEQSNQRKIEEKNREIKLQNDEKMRIIEFKKNLEPFIKIIKDVCIKASSQGVYKLKGDKKLIRGYISVTKVCDSDYDYRWVSYNCRVYTIKKFHITKEDNIIWGDSVRFDSYSNMDLLHGCDKGKYESICLDFVKEKIPEISLGKSFSSPNIHCREVEFNIEF